MLLITEIFRAKDLWVNHKCQEYTNSYCPTFIKL